MKKHQIFNKKSSKSHFSTIIQETGRKSFAWISLMLITILNETALASNENINTQVFTDVTERLLAWVTGGFGKLVVLISIILSVVMGIAGFKWQYIAAPLVLGLMLASVNGILSLFF